MEAKDTVIKPNELGLAIIKHPELPMGQAISIEQAEISFKAGLAVNDTRATAAEIAGDALEAINNELKNELALSRAEAEGLGSQLLDVQRDCIEAHRAGIREVVEFIESCLSIDDYLDYVLPMDFGNRWQAFKKERGL